MKKFALLLLFTYCLSAAAQDTKLMPGPIKGETLTFTKARNYAFCEFYIGSGPVAPGTELQCYNTTSSSTACPAETFASIDPKKLAADVGGSIAVLNPHDQKARKWWVVDELYVYAAGEVYAFDGIKATWVAQMSVADLEAAAKAAQTPYQPLTNAQLSKWVFKKGNQVFLLRAPEGKVYVMQAYTTAANPTLSYDQLPQLGSKMEKLPTGWKYETKTLDKDLVFDVRKATPYGLKHLTLDEFENVYLGCGFDSACNYLP